MTKIVAIGDLHGNLPKIPPCDILLFTGDIFPVWNHSHMFQMQWLEKIFYPYLIKAPAQEIAGIAGNHDFLAYEREDLMYELPWVYLKDETCKLGEFTVHGSPWVPTFNDWVFMDGDERLAKWWKKIPDNCDILMTHGPAYRILDETDDGRRVGSRTLRNRIDQLNLKLHLFGHIHEARGSEGIHHNVTHVNLRYYPVHAPMVFDLD